MTPNLEIHQEADDLVRIRFQLSGETVETSFRSFGTVLTPTSEAAVALALPVAMWSGTAIRIAGGLNAGFVEGVHRSQMLMNSWWPEFKVVAVDCDGQSSARPARGDGIACFFSNGLDSQHTLLSHTAEITDLIFVRGFNLNPKHGEFIDRYKSHVQTVAAAFGKDLITIESPFRQFYRHRSGWLRSHGAAMATIAHLLSHRCRRFYIAGSHSGGDYIPYGTHPLLEHLWSSEGVEIIHDGAGVRRAEKAKAIAEHDVMLENLRVCFHRPEGYLNCGICEKCLRTMVDLYEAGALARCPAFAVPLDYDRVARIKFHDDWMETYYRVMLFHLEEIGADPRLTAAMRHVVKQSRIPWPLVRAWNRFVR